MQGTPAELQAAPRVSVLHPRRPVLLCNTIPALQPLPGINPLGLTLATASPMKMPRIAAPNSPSHEAARPCSHATTWAPAAAATSPRPSALTDRRPCIRHGRGAARNVGPWGTRVLPRACGGTQGRAALTATTVRRPTVADGSTGRWEGQERAPSIGAWLQSLAEHRCECIFSGLTPCRSLVELIGGARDFQTVVVGVTMLMAAEGRAITAKTPGVTRACHSATKTHLFTVDAHKPCYTKSPNSSGAV